eukprot:Seg3172.2 transcript_id=Seg3172.2/GoldUCD/mRNA.D3Y31 product="Protein phosphatase 1 regulatory subunit 12C" protein_id=Seg3172.2/GoldUCD/D3Y31
MESNVVRLKFAFREAVENSDLAILKTLINQNCGCGVNHIRKMLAEERFDGYTSLQKACVSQNKSIASLLVECGVDVEQRGKHGWTALHAAVFACKEDTTIVSLLLNSCANVVARDDHGCLPVDLAEHSNVRELLVSKMAQKGHSELAEMYKKLENIKQRMVLEADETSAIEPSDLKVNFQGTVGESCFYTACEQREQFLSDKPALRRDQGGRRRIASWNVKRKRDSGISVDDSEHSDYLTFV